MSMREGLCTPHQVVLGKFIPGFGVEVALSTPSPWGGKMFPNLER